MIKEKVMREDLLEKLKKTEKTEEFIILLKKNGIDIEKEKAEEYFKTLHRNGEIDDDELDKVSGGGCYSSEGYLMTTCGYRCSNFTRSVAAGNKENCSSCMYWDKTLGDIGSEIGTWFGVPLKCLHPANKL